MPQRFSFQDSTPDCQLLMLTGITGVIKPILINKVYIVKHLQGNWHPHMFSSFSPCETWFLLVFPPVQGDFGHQQRRCGVIAGLHHRRRAQHRVASGRAAGPRGGVSLAAGGAGGGPGHHAQDAWRRAGAVGDGQLAPAEIHSGKVRYINSGAGWTSVDVEIS